MTLDPDTEKTLVDWYQQFHEKHDTLKDDFTERRNVGLYEANDPLASTYGQFSEQHNELKQSLFSSIPNTAPPVGPLALGFPISRRVAVQLAVCLLALVGIVTIPALLSKPAYALNDVFSRVSGASGVYFGGYIFSPNQPDTRIPIEFYAESPHTFWLTIYKTLRDETGRIFVETGYRASDGGVLHQGSNNPSESAMISTYARRDRPAWANIEMQNRLSQMVGTAVFFSSTEGFDYVGQERFERVRCDVFERKTENIRQCLYIDPSQRVPVGAAGYVNDSVTALWVINRVVLDPIELPDHVRISAPEELNQESQTAFERFVKDPQFAHTEVHFPFAANIGRSTLVCWADPHNVAKQRPKFELVTSHGDGVAASTVDLGQTSDSEVIWNWVQLTPSDPNLQGSPLVKVTTNQSRTIVPIRLGTDEVANVIGTMSSDDNPTEKNRILEKIGISIL